MQKLYTASLWLLGTFALNFSVSAQLFEKLPAKTTEYLINANGTLYFSGSAPLSDDKELWMSDGTTGGTKLLKDINPGAKPSEPRYLTMSNGLCFFTADDGVHGRELWKTDGTAAGTVMVKDINPPFGRDYAPYYLTDVNGTLYFVADDGVNGAELWKSDGTAAGTVMVKNIFPGDKRDANPRMLTAFKDKLYFFADSTLSGDGRLYVSDGTAAGTQPVSSKNFRSGYWDAPCSMIKEANGQLFFAADDGVHGYELWRTNGTDIGTTLVKNIDTLPFPSNPFGFTGKEGYEEMNGYLFFTANDGIHGDEVWRSDGTEAGTVMVKDIYPGSLSSYPYTYVKMNGTLYFKANDGVNGAELWKTDGTEAGTALAADISPTWSSSPSRGKAINNMLFFGAYHELYGDELWGSTYVLGRLHTFLIQDFNPGTRDGGPSSITQCGNKVFLRATLDGLTADLWVFDPSKGMMLMPGITGSFISTENVALQIDRASISIYPNPAMSMIKVTVKGLKQSKKVNWKIMDNTGKVVKQNNEEILDINTILSINISNLTAGSYYFILQGEGVEDKVQFVKQ